MEEKIRYLNGCRTCFNFYYISIVFLLVTIEFTHGYSTVSMNRLCSKRGGSVSLSASSATNIVLDYFNYSQPCRIEINAPATFEISMLFTQRRRAVESIQSGMPSLSALPKSCLLTVSHVSPQRENEKTKLSIDLCSPSAFESLYFTEQLPAPIVLDWHPTFGVRGDDVLALEIVLASVGRGNEICSRPTMFPCISGAHYTMYCISSELTCDGRRNCPYSGNDETELLCDAEEYDRFSPNKNSPHGDNFRFGQGLQFLASEMIRKLIVTKNNNKNPDPLIVTTEKSTVLWFEDDLGRNRSDSLPNVLNHYGPWGYLMLGMLICGTVLMFCGLWECCCRRPKTPPANAGPTLLIINQGAEGLEVPTTPGPPRYEDLDQPPSYTTLFPSLKLNINNPDNQSSEVPSSSQATNDRPIEIYTIDCPEPDTRPKQISIA